MTVRNGGIRGCSLVCQTATRKLRKVLRNTLKRPKRPQATYTSQQHT